MIREAAADPAVLAVKMTIYRTGTRSELVPALMKAALMRQTSNRRRRTDGAF